MIWDTIETVHGAIVSPLGILIIGIITVLGLILVAKLNAFLALITAAMVVSVLAPGEPTEKIKRVAEAFGVTAGRIGITIAAASIIGECMMLSGAADRIVQAFMRLLGKKHTPTALMASGFVLGVPVFFDTVFYLLVPLARSVYRRTGKHFVLSVLAICAGSAVTHTLVPPTPGPLAVAAELKIDIGIMILIGGLVGIPMAIAGLLYAMAAERILRITPTLPESARREEIGQLANDIPSDDADTQDEVALPRLLPALLPVLLPLLLISSNTVMKAMAEGAPEKLVQLDQIVGMTSDPATQTKGLSAHLIQTTAIVGDQNFAMMVAMVFAVGLLKRQRGMLLSDVAKTVEPALMSGGLIILITSAGGAFGEMIKTANIQDAIRGVFTNPEQGIGLLLLGFGVASLLKMAQGSTTVAMITGAGIISGFVPTDGSLPFHAVYLAMAIGSGGLVGSWMNDSGFWVVAKLSGFTEIEGLKTWSLLCVVMGITGFLATLVYSQLMPLVKIAGA